MNSREDIYTCKSKLKVCIYSPVHGLCFISHARQCTICSMLWVTTEQRWAWAASRESPSCTWAVGVASLANLDWLCGFHFQFDFTVLYLFDPIWTRVPATSTELFPIDKPRPFEWFGVIKVTEDIWRPVNKVGDWLIDDESHFVCLLFVSDLYSLHSSICWNTVRSVLHLWFGVSLGIVARIWHANIHMYTYVYMCVHTYVPNICIVGSEVNLVLQLGLNPISLNNPYTVWNLYGALPVSNNFSTIVRTSRVYCQIFGCRYTYIGLFPDMRKW